MKTLLITILALVSFQLNAQTWVQVPDPNFQNYLTAQYPAGAFMTSGGNFYIDADHAAVQAEDTLILNSMSLTSIEGVQAFENLVVLNCSNNYLTALPVNLPIGLKDFYCGSNQLTQLPALPGSLLWFGCEYNLLTSLPSLPSSLLSLACNGNQLTTLPALPNQLIQLVCSENNLTNLPALPQSLQLLGSNNNNLISLPLLPNNLHILYCGFNQLTTLPDIPTNMQLLDCQWNQLTELPDLPLSLTYLNCDSNQISVLPDLPDQLDQLICSRNQLTEITELPSTLTYFFCYNNQILCFVEFPVSIQMLEIGNNPFTCLPNYIPVMNSDYLSFPLCDANNPNGCTGARGIEGAVFKDVNANCSHTGGDLTYIPMSVYDTSGNLIVSSTSLANGNYYFAADSGTYELSVNAANLAPVMQVTCPAGNTSTAVVPFADTVVSGGDFGLICSGFDLGVQSIVPYGWIFPGQTHELSILAGDLTAQYNMYCASGISGEVSISLTGPGVVTFAGSPTSVSGNSAVYSIADFGALNANEFFASVLTDTSAFGGADFCVTVTVSTTVPGDLQPSNNSYTYCYEVVNSYDPNIKQTYPEIVAPGFDDDFNYTIYFQNTGNAPAFNIRLADTLDANLDLSTFKVVQASDEFTVVLHPDTRLLTVRFPGIMLPDSTTDPEGSIGFIQYRIKPVSGLPDGTMIHNTAYIYFDYNAPIVTNTSENWFTDELGIAESKTEPIQLYPNPAENTFFVHSESEIQQITLCDINGKQVAVNHPKAKTTIVDVSDLRRGIYIVTIQTNAGVETKRLIVR